ncbi:MAG: helix-turn-helix domain-containing protein [Tannerella sp.]|nr:helix-turn-helix domain-containing protein [Tannerella sp.]
MLKVSDVAEILGVSTSCIYKKAKEIGGVKIGAALRFEPDSIRDYINKRRMPNQGEFNCEAADTLGEPLNAF